MTTGVTQTKGTKLYFGYAPGASSSDPDGIVVHKVACPTGITGLSSGEAPRVDVTCLDSEAREYKAGLQDLPSIQIPVNLIPRSEAHQALMAAEDQGSELIMPWMLVLSDNTSAPTTLDSNGHLASPGPTNRYWKGYVSNFSEDYAVGEYIRATVTVQLTTRIFRENPTADLP